MSGDKAGYFLTEEEERLIPTREELRMRFNALPQAEQDRFVETGGSDEVLPLLFGKDELAAFVKGRDGALAAVDELVRGGYPDDFAEKRDAIWREGFRREDFGDLASYQARTRIWSAPF